MNGSASRSTHLVDDWDELHTCVSSIGHSPRGVIDHISHYGSCISIAERDDYFKFDGSPLWEHELNTEIGKLQREQHHEDDESSEGGNLKDDQKIFESAKNLVKRTIFLTALEIDGEFKRINLLRHEIGQEPPVKDGTRETSNFSQLLSNVIKKRRESRAGNESSSSPGVVDWIKEGPRLPSELLEDLLKDYAPVDPQEGEQMHKQLELHRAGDEEGYNLLKDSKAYIMQFALRKIQHPKTKQTESYLKGYSERHSAFRGKFPHQKVTMYDLFNQSDVIQTGSDTVRYIHIPTNNMDWVEQVIVKYYGDDRPNFAHTHSEKASPSNTYRILRPEYWRGQQHGGNGLPVHSRHMRPICETPRNDSRSGGDVTQNLTLFMPYLHWETSRKSSMMADIIYKTAEEERQRKQARRRQERESRQKEFKAASAGKSPVPRIPRIRHEPDMKSRQTPASMAIARDAFMRREHNLKPRLALERPLARILLYAAKLYESMALFKDKKMVQEYLFKDSLGPLHPRRTLDQSYYWTLRSTETRDCDQVVYRHTRPRGDHKFMQKGEEKAHKNFFKQLLAPAARPEWKSCPVCDPPEAACNPPETAEWTDKWQWRYHTADTDEKGCEYCRNDVMKLARVIMVDQLWMWILAGNTILTCFPKRYGINKPDPSGVHKSIRMRVSAMTNYELRSVYDLALIILDECTNTFFDRTKARDQQPRLTDIFSESIGRIAHMQTILFEHLWRWTKEANKVYRSGAVKADSKRLHVPLLDIRREGKLQREIKDIIDELDMMIYLGAQQSKVLKRFKRLVQQMTSPKAAYGEPEGSSDRRPPPLGQQRIDSGDSDEPLADTPAPGSDAGRTDVTLDDSSDPLRNYHWFSDRAEILMADVKDRVGELESLKKSALSTAENVKELLSLKQQQASVIQAYESVRQAEETVRQGRSIMMFTIVTIIFLPLSFMSSVFGMNAKEFSIESKTSLWMQMPIMFGVSGFVIAVTLLVAFSSMVRSLVWSFFTYLSTEFVVKTKIFSLWLHWNRNAVEIDTMTIHETESLMYRVREKKVDSMWERWEAAKCEEHRSKDKSQESSVSPRRTQEV